MSNYYQHVGSSSPASDCVLFRVCGESPGKGTYNLIGDCLISQLLVPHWENKHYLTLGPSISLWQHIAPFGHVRC